MQPRIGRQLLHACRFSSTYGLVKTRLTLIVGAIGLALELLRDEAASLPPRMRDEVVFWAVAACSLVALALGYPLARPWILDRGNTALLFVTVLGFLLFFRAHRLYSRLRGRKEHWLVGVAEIVIILIVASHFRRPRVAVSA